MTTIQKILPIDELKQQLDIERGQDKKIVLCLGVFDLVHPGHIKHFQEAKAKGDILVVAITANRYVNKGPDRPVFDQVLRMESVAAIECVDYVVLNDTPDGIFMIQSIKPTYYAKGIEYKKAEDDVTGKIQLEVNAVEKNGGSIFYTDDVVFSSSKLLNTYFSKHSPGFETYIHNFKKQHSLKEIQDIIEGFQKLKVLVIGDAILDQYVYVEPLGVSGKGTHLVAKCNNEETFLGGSFAVANHVASFTSNTTLLTAVGKDYISDDGRLNSHIKKELLVLPEMNTLVKRRYLQKDGQHLTKFFETYSTNENLLNALESQKLAKYIQENAKKFDLVLVCDFGNGLLNPMLNQVISQVPNFLAINTQINSGNRGYHVVTKYNRADYISLNEPEIRLTTHDQHSDLKDLIENVAQSMHCNNISVTKGVNGAVVYDKQKGINKLPAFTNNVVDRVGAGDSYLALSALALASKSGFEVAGFLGSVAAALDIQIIGNKKCIEKISFLKYITTLLK